MAKPKLKSKLQLKYLKGKVCLDDWGLDAVEKFKDTFEKAVFKAAEEVLQLCFEDKDPEAGPWAAMINLGDLEDPDTILGIKVTYPFQPDDQWDDDAIQTIFSLENLMSEKDVRDCPGPGTTAIIKCLREWVERLEKAAEEED